MTDAAAHIEGMGQHLYDFDWNDLAFGSKKPIKEPKATFIAAPRELSQTRIKQLIKEYLPTGNIVFGIAKEQYVNGLAPNPAFRMLSHEAINDIVRSVNARSPKHQIRILRYFQRDLKFILEKVPFQQVVLVRGSWHTTFHNQPAYYVLANANTPFTYVSPFVDEAEARAYASHIEDLLAAEQAIPTAGTYTDEQMMTLAGLAAGHSLDYSFQTGVVLGKRTGSEYKLLEWSCNRVVPYQTYAMHFGNSREDNFSPPHDLNHYDTIHAEVEMIIKAGKKHVDLADTSLFINLLPCPACARMFTQTDIQEFVYQTDHSEGYAIKLLEKAGKSVRRLV